MKAVHIIYAHTKHPQRKYSIPTTVEVTYFLHFCRNFKIDIDSIKDVVVDKKINVFSYCVYCWRHPIPSRKTCAYHSSSTVYAYANSDKANSRYKEGKRQKKFFDAEVGKILTQEVMGYHEGKYTKEDLFIPQTGLAGWLKTRRPNVWNALNESNQEIEQQDVLKQLNNFLNDGKNLPYSTAKLYSRLNEHLMNHPLLIWPALLRAEGWFLSRQKLKKQWGGKRGKAFKSD